MKVSIAPDALLLGLQGCVAAHITGVQVAEDRESVYRTAMEARLDQLRHQYDACVQQPEVSGYQTQLAQMGYPNTEPANLRLIRSCLERGVNPILNVVDAYNSVALNYGASFGVHDAAKLKGTIEVCRAQEGRKIRPLFSKRDKKLAHGDLIYQHENQVLAAIGSRDCDADAFKITPDTTELFAMILGHEHTSVTHNRNIVNDFVSALRLTCPEVTLSWVEVITADISAQAS
ncbi:phenylalanine--tRNA ligase beta subunit-related protein [Reinekea blandensis]|uniref:B3/B4 tRNA-binding domain-containing protein n=1 Tax=Reinekea blandensis MED297 TaxID=314283 RepID=A4BF13_9GAMM|nr:phenylalanine--tRNA ligase beta subunit-related protein [Reinekea blandensis]EAR09348.1 hypothetical protein MED297_18708 [Reinekea sp. MED297] [Reinekea blandensis MED297]